ncbi:MAG: hypothetical protein WBX02_03635 [Terriglobales bacterium]
MNRSLITIAITVFAAASLCGNLIAQSPQTAPAVKVAPGSVLLVELTKSVNAKKAKKGDEVTAKITQDLRDSAGAVIVPKDTKVIGHVTEAQPRSKDQESELAITFDEAIFKHGASMQMPMAIQAIIAPRNPSTSESGVPAPVETRDTTDAVPNGRQGPGTPPNGVTAAQTPTAPGQAPGQARPRITGSTQGVVGIPNLKLAAAPNATEGSLVTSEKNNVKLDDGTLLLLRVQQ